MASKELQKASVDPNYLLKQYAKKNDKNSPASQKRIIKELKLLVSQPEGCERFKVFPNANDVYFWKVLIIGPPNTPYNYGVFMITLKFSDEFPVTRPEVKFITPIYHYNIAESGRICGGGE